MKDKKNKVQNIFDNIALRYDFLNHLLSFGIDFYWRNKALKLTKLNSNSILLDVACGTGDFSIEAKKYEIKNIFGADLSFNMLKQFTRKCGWINGNILQMVAENIPIKVNSITNITVAFGVRNFYDIKKAFKSFYDILTAKGKVTILEFSLPKNRLMKFIYCFYFNNILPVIGKIISKDKSAYSYLPESVKEFDEKINLTEMLKETGFIKVEKFSLTFGIVQVVIAEK